jgi:hypothetical protein
MKTIYTILLVVLCSTLSINAQKVVALHSPANGVQYFNDDVSLQTAYAAAVAGDTIYLPGGTHVPPARFEKQLTIFGAGHYPSATVATFPTKITGNFTISDEADGLYLEGTEITGSVVFDTSEKVDDVTIKRCKMAGISIQGDRTNAAEDNFFIENIIGSISVPNLYNSMFYNNIINGGINNLYNIIFINNLSLYSDVSGTVYPPINYASNCMFKNNIFLQEVSTICGGAGASTWTNNIFCTTNVSIPQLGVDPILVDNYTVPRTDVLVNQTGGVFSYDDDYHLQPAAALLYLGDDGDVTGIYGGTFSWKEFSIPINPHISSKTISPTTDENGFIQVNINVQAQDN